MTFPTHVPARVVRAQTRFGFDGSGLRLRLTSAAIALLDPHGHLRRAGMGLETLEVVAGIDVWTPRDENTFFRVYGDYLYKKTIEAGAFGGYTIRRVHLSNARLVREWLEG